MAGLAKVPGVEKIEIKPQVHEWRLHVVVGRHLRTVYTWFDD